MAAAGSGILFVIAAPSGAGKTTVALGVVRQMENIDFSISYTTRAPREGEESRRDYHFIDRRQFESMIEEGAFLEWAHVFDQLYGTGLEATRKTLSEGRDLLLDIDVQGARQVRQGPLESVSVMIFPPDYATLESRLCGRGSESDPERRRRLTQALAEAKEYKDFDFMVVNDDLNETVSAVCAIIRSERRRVSRSAARAEAILASFSS